MAGRSALTGLIPAFARRRACARSTAAAAGRPPSPGAVTREPSAAIADLAGGRRAVLSEVSYPEGTSFVCVIATLAEIDGPDEGAAGKGQAVLDRSVYGGGQHRHRAGRPADRLGVVIRRANGDLEPDASGVGDGRLVGLNATYDRDEGGLTRAGLVARFNRLAAAIAGHGVGRFAPETARRWTVRALTGGARGRRVARGPGCQ